MTEHALFRHGRLRPLILAVAASLALAACVGATPYQPIGASRTSGGYAEQRLEENRFRVLFAGNQFTSRERVENYLLFRAAELTLQNGYDGFTIVQRDVERDVRTRVTPRRDPFYDPFYGPYGFWRPSWRYYGPGGWRYWSPWRGDPFWASSVDVDRIQRYEAIAEIVMFRGSRPQDPMSFDARQVMANLGPTIELPR